MEIILKADIPGLGEEGDIKSVKDGYARNYLIPKKIAVINNKRNREEFEAKKEEIEARKAKKREAARTLEERLKTMDITIEKKAGENGKLFGSVTNSEIAEKLLKHDIDIDRRNIELIKPIKVVGEHKVRVKLHESIQPELTIHVVAEGETEKQISEEELKRMEEEQAEKAVEEEEETDEKENIVETKEND
jgi:large subunit ribosomal protein L9